MRIAVLKEQAAGERRVAATPETVRKFVALGATVAVEAGAGDAAGHADAAYADAGATIADRAATLAEADRSKHIMYYERSASASVAETLSEVVAPVASCFSMMLTSIPVSGCGPPNSRLYSTIEVMRVGFKIRSFATNSLACSNRTSVSALR